jgi:hypothetical protein
VPKLVPETQAHREAVIKLWASRTRARDADAIRVRAFRALNPLTATDADVDAAFGGPGWRQNPPQPTIVDRFKSAFGRRS